MKPSSNNNQLDNFVRAVLKSPDTDLQPVDWSEVEVLLRHEQKLISIGANKKTIFISLAAVIVVIGVFSISKIIQYYASLPAETETLIDSTNSIFSVIDTQKIITSDSISFMVDSAKLDSSALVSKEHKTDSILAVSDVFLKRINDRQTYAREKQKQNGEKTLADTSSVKTILEFPPVDTALKHTVQDEIKPDIPLPLSDTSQASTPSKKSRKNKKQKSTPADSSKGETESSSETKPDSLKQR